LFSQQQDNMSDVEDEVEVAPEPMSKLQAREAGELQSVNADGDGEVSLNKGDLASAMKAVEAAAQIDAAAHRQKYDPFFNRSGEAGHLW
jgi:hypothetical protein